jgi:hypothetical protein
VNGPEPRPQPAEDDLPDVGFSDTASTGESSDETLAPEPELPDTAFADEAREDEAAGPATAPSG